MNLFKKFIPIFLIILISFFAFKPLLNQGFFPMHDDTQPSRVFEMAQGLKSGMFPVRWSSELGFGYGYPIFNFYAPLAYYVGAIFILLGFNPIDSTKIMMILGILLAGFSMYFLSKEFFGKKIALLGSLLYVYAPYHALNIYVRGDVAEFYAYGFIPLVFWGLYKIYKEERLLYVSLTAIFFSFVVLSHNLTAFIATPFYIFYALILFGRNKKRYTLFLSLALGVLISSFYWLPAIFEMNYTNVVSQIGGGADFRDHFVCIGQIWSSQWGYGGSIKGCIDGLSFMLGKYHILLTALAFIVSIVLSKKKAFDKDIIYTLFTFLVFGGLSVFFMLSASRLFWEFISPMEFIQYPWRLLLIASFSVSFVGAGLFWLLRPFVKKEIYYIVLLGVIVALVFLNSKFFIPQNINSKTPSDYVSKSALNWKISKISSEYLPKKFDKPTNILEVANFNMLSNKDVKIINVIKKSNKIVFNLSVAKDTTAVFPIAYFPAWKAYINGKETVLKESARGIRVIVPQGKVNLQFVYKETPIELLGNILSLAGLVISAIAIIKKPK